MSSYITKDNLRTYKKDNNEFIIPGLMLNSAIVSNEGADGFYSVFAHQINWSYTTFGSIDISTQPGYTYTEKLLNTIESYIYSKGINNLSLTTKTGVAQTNKNITTSTATSGQKVITNISLSSNGTLSYSYNYVYAAPNHTHTAVSTGTYASSADKDISNSDEHTQGMKVITGIKLTATGALSYSYSYVYDSHTGHSTNTGVAQTNKSITTNTPTSGQKVITNISLSSNGTLSYSYNYVYAPHTPVSTGTYLGHSNITTNTATSGKKVITGISISSTGVLSYSYSYIYASDSHTAVSTGTYLASVNKDISSTLNNSGMKVITGIKLTSSGLLSYTYSYVFSSTPSTFGSASFSGNITMMVQNQHDNDQYIYFRYSNSTIDSYSWRIGYKGTGAGDANYFVIESSHGGDWTTVLKLGLQTYNATFATNVYAGAFYATSDENKKNILNYLNIDINDIANAPIIRFTWKEQLNSPIMIGSIAQYWENVLPESVNRDINGLTLNYGVIGTISGIVNSRKIIELEKENKELKQKIKDLENKFNEKIRKLEMAIEQLI